MSSYLVSTRQHDAVTQQENYFKTMDKGFSSQLESVKDDVKPFPEYSSSGENSQDGKSKKWSPGKWQDPNRKSAFQPYKQACTVLTNLQRGNTQAETPIPQETDVGFHTRAGQGEILAEDINNEPHIDVKDSNGLTALHWASAYGQLISVQQLIEAGAKVDLEGPDGETPLLLAANGGHHDVVRLLLGEGADPNHIDHVIMLIIKVDVFVFYFNFVGREFGFDVRRLWKPSSLLQ